MKIEKHGTKYRVRKMYKGTVYLLSFDKLPDEKDISIAFAEKLKEEGTTEKGSFEDFALKYIKNRKNVTSPSTERTYNIKLKQLSDGFKQKNLSEITAEDVQVEINNLAGRYEPKTVHTAHGFIASVLGEYRPNLKLRTKLPQKIRKEQYEPTNEDIKRILGRVKGGKYDVAFQLGVLGCRVAEICAFTLDDLDDNNLRIHKNMVMNTNGQWVIKETPKTDESNRTLPLPKSLATKIKKQGFIYDGHPNALNRAMHRYQRELGIPQFRFYDLRHYFASYAHSKNIPDADIMAIGGWKTDHVMKRVYRNSIEESKKKSMSILTKGLIK
jgi:integrase